MTDRSAKLLVGLKKARYAPEDPAEQEIKKYKRRDMRPTS